MPTSRPPTDPEAFWAEQADRLSWAERWDTRARLAPTRRSPSGSRAASSTRRTTASTGTSRPATATRWRSTGWVSRRTTPATITYAQLKDEVSKAANALTDLGVAAGDRVAIYMPMIPEAIVAMLACARIGAPHTVVFGGFSADALASPDRRLPGEGRHHLRRRLPPRRPVRAQAGGRRGPHQDATGTVEKVLVVRRTGQDVEWDDASTCGGTTSSTPRRPSTRPRRSTPSTRSTSCTPPGTTGKPKGILHTTGGYLTGASYTHHAVFDLKPETDVYWCTADIGWVTGHSYIVYGPLANGVTQVLYEGTPDSPERAAGGRSSRSTASRSSTPHPPRSAPS